MSSNNHILTAREIHRQFQTNEGVVRVLNGASITMTRSEMTAITGASGVGKSTLLHLLGGLDRPNAGEIRIGDTLLNNQSETQLARFRTDNVGFVFQSHYLLEDFSALENVMMPQLVLGKSKSEARAKGELLLDRVGLTSRASHRPKQLSGGEQQRVAVARALANDPKIVLADEPSGNLDTETGRKLHELLFALNTENGTTFLIATHNEELAGRCGRILEIKNGMLSDRTQTK